VALAGSPSATRRRRRFGRLPRHVGIIPDGNRRWAKERGLPPEAGYAEGVVCGLRMLDDCAELGIEEVSVYGFTQDNTKRPREQRLAFSKACVDFAETVRDRVALLVVGDPESPVFPPELRPYTNERQGEGLKVNMLVNYGWQWDLATAAENMTGKRDLTESLASRHVSRIDMVVRWGGCRRLSGFLPVQSVYADFYVVDDYWPDYELEQFHEALEWYQTVEKTLGG
jgi:undecaprenyl diphosphate synthase